MIWSKKNSFENNLCAASMTFLSLRREWKVFSRVTNWTLHHVVESKSVLSFPNYKYSRYTFVFLNYYPFFKRQNQYVSFYTIISNEKKTTHNTTARAVILLTPSIVFLTYSVTIYLKIMLNVCSCITHAN